MEDQKIWDNSGWFPLISFKNLKTGAWQIVCIFSQYIDNLSKDNFVDVSQIYLHNIESFRGLNIIKLKKNIWW